MTFRILIVDDITENIDLLRKVIVDVDVNVAVATSGEKALVLIEKNRPDLILLDVMMPGVDGFSVCREIRKQWSKDEIAIIFVTGCQDDIAKGFDAGGNDYITKPISTDEVLSRIQHQLERLALTRELNQLNDELEEKVRERTAELTLMNKQLREEINERRYLQDRLKYLAEHDFISRTYNRNALESHISEIIANTHTDKGITSYLQIDIDRFRLVNESCGSIAGDELLSESAEIIASCLAREDFLARIGGDRFGLVCLHKSDLTGPAIARIIAKRFEEYRFRWDDREFSIDVTIVIVTIDNSILSFDQLLVMADEMMFLAKRKGGKTIQIYDASQKKALMDRSGGNWALRLVDAFKQDNFRVFVQKICPLEGKQTGIRLEALVRLYEPENNQMLTPNVFIHVAERYQLLPDIDRLMIEKVCAFFSNNHNFLTRLDSISINLSALSLRDTTLVSYIQSRLDKYQIPAEKITFEVTETEQVFHINISSKILQELTRLGCKIAIDDFGSGYASFNYLREFPFDIIKIDGVFVKDMENVGSSYSMVSSIIDLANKLGKPIVAEYVESQSLADLLKTMGVEWGQGYHFHKPELLSPDAIERMIAELNE